VIPVHYSRRNQQAFSHPAGMPSITVRLSLNEVLAASVALASPNLLESTTRSIAAAATNQVTYAVGSRMNRNIFDIAYFAQNAYWHLNSSHLYEPCRLPPFLPLPSDESCSGWIANSGTCTG
jgi:hypothetical protein